MANIDVSFLMNDPDFADPVQLVRRASATNEYGEHIVTDVAPLQVMMVIQTGTADDFALLPEGSRLRATHVAYYQGELFTESPNGYADVIIWQGEHYQVLGILENFTNYGQGFTKAAITNTKVNNHEQQ